MRDSSMLLAALFVGGMVFGFGWLVVWCYDGIARQSKPSVPKSITFRDEDES